VLDHVVLVWRDVFLVSGEDDKVVARRQRLPVTDGTQIVVREEVHRPARPVEPRDELQIPVVEAEWHAEVEERPAQIHAAVSPGDIPGVAPTVAVAVGEVVRGHVLAKTTATRFVAQLCAAAR
jgi:hypothetical protein